VLLHNRLGELVLSPPSGDRRNQRSPRGTACPAAFSSSQTCPAGESSDAHAQAIDRLPPCLYGRQCAVSAVEAGELAGEHLGVPPAQLCPELDRRRLGSSGIGFQAGARAARQRAAVPASARGGIGASRRRRRAGPIAAVQIDLADGTSWNRLRLRRFMLIGCPPGGHLVVALREPRSVLPVALRRAAAAIQPIDTCQHDRPGRPSPSRSRRRLMRPGPLPSSSSSSTGSSQGSRSSRHQPGADPQFVDRHHPIASPAPFMRSRLAEPAEGYMSAAISARPLR
jgi:hypothetical protein